MVDGGIYIYRTSPKDTTVGRVSTLSGLCFLRSTFGDIFVFILNNEKGGLCTGNDIID